MVLTSSFWNALAADEWGRADWSRRRTLDMLAKGGLAALMAGLPQSARAADDEVNLGYLPITDAAALLIAHAKGYFADEGLKAGKPTPVRSWAALVEGFAAGKFNLVHLLKPIPVWMRYNNNIPVKVLAWAHTNGSGVVVGGQSGIADFKDFGGKRIAVPFWYSMHNVVLQYVLRSVGLKPVIRAEGAVAGNEVALQILPPPEMLAALAARKIDGYIVAEPFNALGEIKAGARMLRFTGDIWKNHPCCVVTVHERDTIERPQWAQKVTNAIVRAQAYLIANREECARLLSQDGGGYIPLPGEVVVKAMTDYGPAYDRTGAIRHRDWGASRIDFQPWPYRSATKLIVEAMAETVVEGDAGFLSRISGDKVADDLIDYRFVTEAMKLHGAPWTSAGDAYTRQETLGL